MHEGARDAGDAMCVARDTVVCVAGSLAVSGREKGEHRAAELEVEKMESREERIWLELDIF
jgi:hypothetical protein